MRTHLSRFSGLIALVLVATAAVVPPTFYSGRFSGDGSQLTSLNTNILRSESTNSVKNTLRIGDLQPANATLNLNGQRISNLATPVGATDAATRTFTESTSTNLVKSTVRISDLLPANASLNMNNQRVANVLEPQVASDAANKGYVDLLVSTNNGGLNTNAVRAVVQTEATNLQALAVVGTNGSPLGGLALYDATSTNAVILSAPQSAAARPMLIIPGTIPVAPGVALGVNTVSGTNIYLDWITVSGGTGTNVVLSTTNEVMTVGQLEFLAPTNSRSFGLEGHDGAANSQIGLYWPEDADEDYNLVLPTNAPSVGRLLTAVGLSQGSTNTQLGWTTSIGLPLQNTNAVDGFMAIGTVTNQPLAPPSLATGHASMVVDTNSLRLWIFINGAWHYLQLN